MSGYTSPGHPEEPHRSSADLYASVPLSEAAYPPIRSITPQTPQVVSPTYAQPPTPAAQHPPSYLAQHGRTPSTTSDYSARDPFRASMPSSRPGTAAGAAVGAGAGGIGSYDPPADYHAHEASGRYSPSERGSVSGIGSGGTDWGSSANLNQIMYRNGPPGAQGGRSDSYLGGGGSSKEVLEDGGAAAAVGAGGRGALRKKGYSGAAAGDYDPLHGPRRTGAGGFGGWWSRKSTVAKSLLALGALAVLIAAIAIPVGVVKGREGSGSGNKLNAAASPTDSGSSSSSSGGGADGANDGTEEGIPTAATPVANWQTAPYGGNGSVVYLEDGSNFTYINNFGTASSLSRQVPRGDD